MAQSPSLGVAHAAGDRSTAGWRSRYLMALTWAFTLFSSARLVSYLPTLWAICASGESSQHSLWTWGIWLGSNLTMALWLHEQNGRRVNRAVAVNAFNAFMCGAIAASIAWLRWLQPGAAFPTLF